MTTDYVELRDPIHGFIRVSAGEMRIVDTPIFQRLRGIRQLGTSYLVYPGAEHTRFAHSLGVMHLASRVVHALRANAPPGFLPGTAQSDVYWAWMEQMLRIIGLTHDLGHPPFSHAGEGLAHDKHETYTCLALGSPEISEAIGAIGEEFRRMYGSDEFTISSKRIIGIYSGKNIANSNESILHQIMDSELDCDKMDYLLRDSHYCGVNYGKYDLDRLVSCLGIATDPDDRSVRKMGVLQSGIHAFEEFVLARYFMFLQVYFHKTRRILDITFARLIKEAVLHGKQYPRGLSYFEWDDHRVMSMLSGKPYQEKMHALMRRDFPRLVLETNEHGGSFDIQQARNKQTLLERAFGDQVIIDRASKYPHSIKLEADSDAFEESGIPIILRDGGVCNLGEVSVALSGICKPIDIYRLYVPLALREKANEVLAESH